MIELNLAEQLVNKINELEKTFSTYMHRAASQTQSTPSQFAVLDALAKHGELRHKDITDITHITKGTLTGVIERLERSGLVQREQDHIDSRAMIVSLTEDGIKFHENARDHFNKIHQNALSKLHEHDALACMHTLDVLISSMANSDNTEVGKSTIMGSKDISSVDHRAPESPSGSQAACNVPKDPVSNSHPTENDSNNSVSDEPSGWVTKLRKILNSR